MPHHPISHSLCVFNSGPAGYRRANLVLARGENRLDASQLSKAQIAALQADPRLHVALPPTPADAEPAKGPLVRPDLDLSLCPAELSAVVALIDVLHRQDALTLTGSGKPEVACLESAADEPIDISAAVRDTAWDWYQAQLTEAEPV